MVIARCCRTVPAKCPLELCSSEQCANMWHAHWSLTMCPQLRYNWIKFSRLCRLHSGGSTKSPGKPTIVVFSHKNSQKLGIRSRDHATNDCFVPNPILKNFVDFPNKSVMAIESNQINEKTFVTFGQFQALQPPLGTSPADRVVCG